MPCISLTRAVSAGFGSGRRCAIGALFGLMVAPVLAATDQPVVPPFEMPFSLEEPLSAIEARIRVRERRTFTFGLTFLIDRAKPLHAERVKYLTGTAARDRDGKYTDLGVPLRLRLKIEPVRSESREALFDQTVTEVRAYAASARGRDKKIADVLLDRGDYKVTLENLRAVPEMQGSPTEFHGVPAYFGK